MKCQKSVWFEVKDKRQVRLHQELSSCLEEIDCVLGNHSRMIIKNLKRLKSVFKTVVYVTVIYVISLSRKLVGQILLSDLNNSI